ASLFVSMFAHGSSVFSGAIFLRAIWSMDRLVDFARLYFVDCEDVHKILYVRSAQAFPIGEARFHERQSLFLRDREHGSKRLAGLGNFLFNRGCGRSVLVDVDLP